VRQGIRVDSVERHPVGSGYLIRTREGDFEAAAVVLATGFFEQPKIPSAASRISADVYQIHSSQYERPEQLPVGAVLVVGSGQSGCQICEELSESGRSVYLSTGSAGRLVRRYRGRDGVWWANKLGFFDRTPAMLPSRQALFAANPHLTGKGGGHTINLHRLAHDGVRLLGHFRDAQGDALAFHPDHKENLAKADKYEADFASNADKYALGNGIELPEVNSNNTDEYYGDDGYRQNVTTDLSLRDAGIGSIVWAAGFRADYGYVKLPILDPDGYPIHDRGVSPHPGLYFVGVHFQRTAKSDLFFGVGEDAEQVVAQLADALRKP
jgi:putative flavoprotein involved in K+ transport